MAFHVSVTPSTATGAVSLTAKPATGTCAPAPCAQVGIGSFSENTPIALSGGAATINTEQLPGGTAYQVVANYAGDGTFAPNTSAPVTVTVTKENSSTAVGFVTFDSGGNPSVSQLPPHAVPYGSSYILQIAVSDSQGHQCALVVAACPTGTVTLLDTGKPLNDFSGSNTVKLNSQAIAEDQPVQLAHRHTQPRRHLQRRQQLQRQHVYRRIRHHHRRPHHHHGHRRSRDWHHHRHLRHAHRQGHHAKYRRRPNR